MLALAAAATYLGMTSDALGTALDGGARLADIVKDKGKTTDGLQAALVTAATKDIDARSGLTDAQRKAQLDALPALVDGLVASSLGHDRSAGVGPLVDAGGSAGTGASA